MIDETTPAPAEPVVDTLPPAPPADAIMSAPAAPAVPVTPVEDPNPAETIATAQADPQPAPTPVVTVQDINAQVQAAAQIGKVPGAGFGVHLVNGLPVIGPFVDAVERDVAKVETGAAHVMERAHAEFEAEVRRSEEFAREFSHGVQGFAAKPETALRTVERVLIVAGLGVIAGAAWLVKAVLKPIPWMAEQAEGWALGRIRAERAA